jgi:hypothetical protein
VPFIPKSCNLFFCLPSLLAADEFHFDAFLNFGMLHRADDSGVHIAAADRDGEVHTAHLHPGGGPPTPCCPAASPPEARKRKRATVDGASLKIRPTRLCAAK